MNLLPRLILLATLLSLAACGSSEGVDSKNGDSNADAGGPDMGFVSINDPDGVMTASVGGVEWACEAGVKDRSMTFKSDKIIMMLKSRLSNVGGAIGADLTYAISLNQLKPGTYTLLSERGHRKAETTDTSLIKLTTDGKHPILESVSGELIITSFDTRRDAEGHLQILKVIGSVEGSFKNPERETLAVRGTFHFAP